MNSIHKVVVEDLEAKSQGNTINSNINILPSTVIIWLHDSTILHFSLSLKSGNPVIKPGFMLSIKEKGKGTWTSQLCHSAEDMTTWTQDGKKELKIKNK